MHLVYQKHYNYTNTHSRNEKRQILFGYELYKHLAAPVLGGLLVLYLSFLAEKDAEITDKGLHKITNRHYCLQLFSFLECFFVSSGRTI